MSKKLLIGIVSVLAVIISAGIAVAVLAFFQGNTEEPVNTPTAQTGEISPDPAAQEAQTTPDLSADLKACTIVSKQTIAEAFPELATLRDGDNLGVGNEFDGSRSQTCVYRLEEGQALTNRISVTVTDYQNESRTTLAKEGYVDPISLSRSGVEAYAYTESDQERRFVSVIVFSGTTSELYAITLPASSELLSEQAAQAALTRLAESAEI